MGYCASMRDSRFHIKREDLESVRIAIYRLTAGGKQHSWVAAKQIAKCFTQEDTYGLFAEWGFEIEREGEEEDIIGIQFAGDKLGDEEVMLEAIAPWVKKGSYIEMQGECGCLWRWVFDGEHCNDIEATITWG